MRSGGLKLVRLKELYNLSEITQKWLKIKELHRVSEKTFPTIRGGKRGLFCLYFLMIIIIIVIKKSENQVPENFVKSHASYI